MVKISIDKNGNKIKNNNYYFYFLDDDNNVEHDDNNVEHDDDNDDNFDYDNDYEDIDDCDSINNIDEKDIINDDNMEISFDIIPEVINRNLDIIIEDNETISFTKYIKIILKDNIKTYIICCLQ